MGLLDELVGLAIEGAVNHFMKDSNTPVPKTTDKSETDSEDTEEITEDSETPDFLESAIRYRDGCLMLGDETELEVTLKFLDKWNGIFTKKDAIFSVDTECKTEKWFSLYTELDDSYSPEDSWEESERKEKEREAERNKAGCTEKFTEEDSCYHFSDYDIVLRKRVYQFKGHGYYDRQESFIAYRIAYITKSKQRLLFEYGFCGNNDETYVEIGGHFKKAQKGTRLTMSLNNAEVPDVELYNMFTRKPLIEFLSAEAIKNRENLQNLSENASKFLSRLEEARKSTLESDKERTHKLQEESRRNKTKATLAALDDF